MSVPAFEDLEAGLPGAQVRERWQRVARRVDVPGADANEIGVLRSELALEGRAPFAVDQATVGRAHSAPTRPRGSGDLEVDGLIIDWTARQFRSGCEWPHVMHTDEFEEEFGPPLPCCPDCGSSKGPPRLLGKRIKTRPLREHRCSGPEADATAEVRPLVEQLYQRLSPQERHDFENALRAGLQP